jgi:hypothetical protein
MRCAAACMGAEALAALSTAMRSPSDISPNERCRFVSELPVLRQPRASQSKTLTNRGVWVFSEWELSVMWRKVVAESCWIVVESKISLHWAACVGRTSPSRRVLKGLGCDSFQLLWRRWQIVMLRTGWSFKSQS